jgi:hypothetical protein
MRSSIPLASCFFLAAATTLIAEAPPIETDICIYGATASGVAAACTAAKLGKTVALVEPGRHVGGLTSGGLGQTDIGNKAAIGGFAHDFYKRLGRHYGKPEAWTFEPHVAEEELRALLEEAHATVYFGQPLKAVRKEGAKVTELSTEDGNRYRAKIFIDCTYEGDLMAGAGVSYMTGREANFQFDETLNGVRDQTPKHQFLVPVDPWKRKGEPESGLIRLISADPFGVAGMGDRSIQAYNYRLCLTKNPLNRRPIEPPSGYDPARFELAGRYIEALLAAGKPVKLGMFLSISMVTPEKTDVNNNGPISTDYIGGNLVYPEADRLTREGIAKEHENYIRGLLTFLATDPRVPEEMRRDMSEWGLCKDEFPDTGGWPYALYVREARRMTGEYVMAEKNCRWEAKVDDSVGLGAYGMDSHNCRRIVRDGHVENEGDTQVGVKGPYPVAYRSIVPKADQCTNLLVPVCLSATHIAYGSIRMEPVFMILGQSAATAASLAIDDGDTVQKVDYAKLKERLLADGQILAWTAAAAPGGRPLPPKLPGIVLDDDDAVKTGSWLNGSVSGAQHVGPGYVHDGDSGKGEKSLMWTVEIPKAGDYEIIFHFPPNGNRASNAPITIEAEGHTTVVKVNERKSAGGGAISLGKFHLPQGGRTTVRLSNEGTDGYVAADGLQVLPVQK